AGMPKDKMPEYVFKGTGGLLVNDEELAKRMEPVLQTALGKENVHKGEGAGMGSEDCQILVEPYPETKILYISVGCGPKDVDAKEKKGARPAGNHNPEFRVELPAIAAGTRANAMMLLELLKK